MPITTPKDMVERYNGDIDHFLHVMDVLFVPAIETAGMEAVRPIAEGSDLIPARIIKELELADLVLCDISTHNPNVFFELGVRTALNKPTCYVKDGMTDKIPFDTNALNHYTYDPSLAGWTIQEDIERLSQHITTSISGNDGANSLWKFFGLTTTGQRAQSTDAERQEWMINEIAAIRETLDNYSTEKDDFDSSIMSRGGSRLFELTKKRDAIIIEMQLAKDERKKKNGMKPLERKFLEDKLHQLGNKKEMIEKEINNF